MENKYLERFREWLQLKGHSKSTAAGFSKALHRFLLWTEEQNMEPEQAGYNDILAYINYCKHKGNSQRTQQINTSVLRHFYNCLQQDDAVTENPVSNVQIKGVKRKILYEILTPEELDTIYKSYTPNSETSNLKTENFELIRKRNKMLLGLMIYQGIKTEELVRLDVQDLQLREGKINIAGSRRTEGRTLTLEPHQVYDLMDYMHQTRRQMLALSDRNSNKLFIGIGRDLNINNVVFGLLKKIREKHPKLKDPKQLRTSVISNWLKVHNLRKVQYMAGHRYVSSTESYQHNNIEELQDEIRLYHPIG